jgi:hypothetical protein
MKITASGFADAMMEAIFLSKDPNRSDDHKAGSRNIKQVILILILFVVSSQRAMVYQRSTCV